MQCFKSDAEILLKFGPSLLLTWWLLFTGSLFSDSHQDYSSLLFVFNTVIVLAAVF